MLKISQHIKTNKGMGYLVLTISRLVVLCLNFNLMESCQCKLSVQKLKALRLYFALSKSYCLKRLLYELVQSSINHCIFILPYVILRNLREKNATSPRPRALCYATVILAFHHCTGKSTKCIKGSCPSLL